MEKFEKSLEQSLPIIIKNRTFKFEEKTENDIKCISLYVDNKENPFLVMTLTNTINFFFYPIDEIAFYALVGKIISPQIEISEHNNTFTVLTRQFYDYQKTEEVQEMNKEKAIEYVIQNIKKRLS